MHGLVAPKLTSRISSAGLSIAGSGRVSVSGRNSNSETMLIPRPSRARDLVTIDEVDSTRPISLVCVTMGVGWVYPAARLEVDSLARRHDP